VSFEWLCKIIQGIVSCSVICFEDDVIDSDVNNGDIGSDYDLRVAVGAIEEGLLLVLVVEAEVVPLAISRQFVTTL
jgi:hypothetical protein